MSNKDWIEYFAHLFTLDPRIRKKSLRWYFADIKEEIWSVADNRRYDFHAKDAHNVLDKYLYGL